MTRLPDLRDELVAAAKRLDDERRPAAPAGRQARRRRSGLRRRASAKVLVLALLGLLALAAIGVAATGVLRSGAAVEPRSGKPPTPKTGFGVPTGTVAPPIVVDDPGGGSLQWGLRTFTTTRGYACVQIGRVQDGKLGLVGTDHAFDDDGLFHALGPQVLDRAGCVAADARGHGFLAVHNAEMPASGLPSCLPPSWVRASGGRALEGARPCATRGMRTVDYGLLGPRARSITYTLPSGGRRTVPVAPGTGAFLIVTARERLPATTMPGQIPDGAYELDRAPTARRIVAVSYDDGTTCVVAHGPDRRTGGCPLKGQVPVKVRLPRPSEVATPVSARIERNDEGSFTLHVAFRARVAAEKARAAYVVVIRPVRGPRCRRTGIVSHTLERDVAAGQRVGAAMKMDRGSCSGRYRVDLDYRVAGTAPIGMGYAYPGTPVGSAGAELVR